MQIFGWVFGILAMVVGVVLYRYPSRYGRGFVQALSLVVILGGVYVIWVTQLLVGHTVITRALF